LHHLFVQWVARRSLLRSALLWHGALVELLGEGGRE
jgi:hypothetical protein